MASILFDDPANQPQYDAQKADATQFVNDLANQYGIPAGSTDIANLAGKNPTGYIEGPNDYENFKQALAQQYDERAHNIPGGGGGSGEGYDHNGNPIGGGGGGGTLWGNFSGYGSPNSIQPWNQVYTSPTAEQARATPGYQFQLEEGIKALDKSAAAKGRLLGGGQIKAQTQFGQGLADTTYGETDQRLFRNYADAKDSFFRNEENRYNSQRANLNDQYSMLSGDRNFGLAQDYYGLAANNQSFNQGLQGGYFGLASENQAYNQNRGLNNDYFNQNYALSGLGNPGAPNYGQYADALANLLTGQGNANASGIVGSSNASNAALSSAIRDALATYFNSQQQQQAPPPVV